MNNEITNARKQNMKLYPFYRSISIDLIFFYAIQFLFYTQIKNITPSEVVLLHSFYAIFMIFLQIPASIIVDKLGARKSTILSNVFQIIYLILVLNCNKLGFLIISEFVSALCFSTKDISEGVLITNSLPETRKKGDIFSKLEGKGYRNYFFINSISSILSGFLYVINPYIPVIISLMAVIIATIMSCGFKDIEKIKTDESNKITKIQHNYFKELKDAMKFIIISQRLRSLFIFSGVSWGVICLISTYRSSILVDIGTPTQIITAIAAIIEVASSLGSKGQLAFNKRFKNKSLSIILVTLTMSIIVAGLTVVLNASYMISLAVVTVCCVIINLDKGMSLVLSTRYLGNFSNEEILSQIYAANAMVKNLIRAIIGFVGSYLLGITTTANAMILVGIFMIIISISLIGYMKTRLGLKPEEYGKDDIYSVESDKQRAM